MANNLTPQQQQNNQQRMNQQRGGQQQNQNQQAGGAAAPNGVGPPAQTASQAAGSAALAFFKAQGLGIPQVLGMAQQSKLTTIQLGHFTAMMGAFGPQIQASMRQQQQQTAAAAGARGANANGPSPTILPSAPPTSASQSRPPGAPAAINNAQAPSANGANSQERFKQLLATLQGMTDAQRNQAIANQPTLGALWSSYLQQRQGKAGGTNVRPPGNGNNVRPPLNGNSPAPPLNLTLPPGRVRPPGPQNGAANANNGAGRGSPAMGLQQQQQQQRLAQGNRVGSPANATPQQQQQLQQIQQQQAQNILLQQQQSGVSPAGTGPIPISRPQASTAAHLASLPSTSPAPHPNPGGPRPTLSGGLASGPVVGTPSLLQRQGTGWDEATRAGGAGNQGAAAEMRKRRIREVVDSVEKGEKLEEGVEDLLLELVDELIDSSTQFAARLAKHRKSNTLDVRDLQLHLERNHNIRVPGSFADEIKQGQSQTARRTPVVNQHAQRVAAVHAAKAAAAAKGN